MKNEKKNSDHYSPDYGDILDRTVVCIGLHVGNLVYYIHTFNNLAKNRVFAVQEVVVDKVDEKLAAPGIRAGICHGDCTPVIPVVLRELILDLVPRIAHAGAGRIPTLDHKSVDDPVEDYAVVIPFLHK